jgi:hypothetical protein
LITKGGSLEDYEKRGRDSLERRRREFFLTKPRERKKSENEGKIALVALNSPCGLIAFSLTLILKHMLDCYRLINILHHTRFP